MRKKEQKGFMETMIIAKAVSWRHTEIQQSKISGKTRLAV
jgi:hypothetical protein